MRSWRLNRRVRDNSSVYSQGTKIRTLGVFVVEFQRLKDSKVYNFWR